MASKRPRRWNSTWERRPVDARGERRCEPVDGSHRVHPADQQRQPLSGYGVGSHEVRGRPEAEQLRSLSDAVGRQAVSLTRRQVGGAVTHPPDNTVSQQAGQPSVYGRARLAEDARQFRRIDERHLAEGLRKLLV